MIQNDKKDTKQTTHTHKAGKQNDEQHQTYKTREVNSGTREG